jgi:predicted O-linked N-acetylglucosamine transferase (SPINDLY family)
MDYLISDRYLTPRGSEAAFTERVLRLPSFYVRTVPNDEPPENPLPMLGSGEMTLGSFSNPAKITSRTLDLWAPLLGALSSARLVLRYYDSYGAADVQDRVVKGFADRGVDPTRIALQAATANWGEHLARYHDIDLALDPLPFSGSTTTFEALWMGVPVVTRPGETMVSRWSASMLHALGLDSFIAHSDEEFIGIAQQCARDPGRLAELRKTLRGRVKLSPLCNGRLRGRQIARLFRAIWHRHCAHIAAGAR